MKSKYYSILSLGVLLAACSGHNEMPQVVFDDAEYINFGAPSATVETRQSSAPLAPGVTQGGTLLNSLLPNTSFGVLGYARAYSPGTQNIDYASGVSPWSTKRQYAVPEVFYSQEVLFNGTTCTYDYGTTNLPRRWFSDDETNGRNDADEYQYSFFSYYPSDQFEIEAPATANVASSPILTYSMPFDSQDENSVLKQSEVKDVMLDVKYNVKKRDGKVKFNYSHALTALSFIVNNYSEGMDLTVYKIVLQGEFWKNMRVDFTKSQVAYDFQDSYKGQFVIYDSKEGMSIPFNQPDFIPDFAKQYMLLISGKPEGLGYLGDLKVHITYKFGAEGQVKTESLTRPGTFTPRPGTKYQAQLNFVGNAFVLQFVVDNGDYWEEGSDSDISFN